MDKIKIYRKDNKTECVGNFSLTKIENSYFQAINLNSNIEVKFEYKHFYFIRQEQEKETQEIQKKENENFLPQLVSEQNVSTEQLQEYIKNIHENVSNLKTPTAAVKKREDGLDYVELAYMKSIADKYYPGWSWHIIKYEFVGDQAVIVHGRLIFFDGIKRQCDMIAGHRVAKSREDKTKYVDIGNDAKSANTDTLKKAMNTYMNIADDVYKKANDYLSDEQANNLINLAGKISKIKKAAVSDAIKKGKVTKKNFEAAKEKLKNSIESIEKKSKNA